MTVGPLRTHRPSRAWVAALGVRDGSSSADMGRAGALLYAPGGVLLILTLPYVGADADRTAIFAVGITALVIAAALWTLGSRIPAPAYPAFTAAGSALITVVLHSGGTDGNAYAFLYVWAVLYAFYYFRQAQALLQASLVALCCIASGNLGSAPTLWLALVVGTVVVAGVWMRTAVAALIRSETTFRMLFERNPEPMWVFDVATLRFLDVNREAIHRYGYSREEFLAMRITDIRPEEDVPDLLDTVSGASAGEASEPRWRHRRKDGTVMTVEVFTHRQVFKGQDAKIATVIDVTERARFEEELRHQAFHDPLTGLANRALFHSRVETALARRSPQGAQVSVLIIDLDGFKSVNDHLGHAAGDALLVGVAARLRSALGPDATPAHIGGDEFTVLLDDQSGIEALVVGERILAALREPFMVGGTDAFVTASIGAASTDSGAPDDLLRDADVAMYSAKNSGKNRCELYEPTMHAAARRRLDMLHRVRQAHEHREFFLEYQPIVTVAGGGTVAGVEALVRWRDPERGVVDPGEFITFAEETGIIVPLGTWVLSSACRQLREWQLRGAASDVYVSVNVSARQLREAGFVDVVAGALAAASLSPHCLVLEVTEGTLVDDIESTHGRLRELREQGVRIAIDDFGSGYSSLRYLRALPLDIVKIDRVFVTGLNARGSDERELTLAIVRLIDTMGVTTIAEGIETAAELDYVRALGIDAGQGYLFSRPLGAAAAGYLLVSGASWPAQPGARLGPAATRSSPSCATDIARWPSSV